MRDLFLKLSQRFSQPKSAGIVLAGIATTIAGLWLFNASSAHFSQPVLLAATGVGLLDLLPHYSPQDAYAHLSSLGEKGRRAYLHFLAVDYVFIGVYSITLAWVVATLVRRSFGTSSKLMQLNLAPVALGLCDVVENSCNLVQLLVFPAERQLAGALAGAATLSKHGATLLVLGLIATLAVQAGRARRGNRLNK